MTYCTDFVCTYQNHAEEDQEDLYRAQLLQAFALNTWNGTVVNATTEELYNELKDNEIINNLLEKMKNIETSTLMKFFMLTNTKHLNETLFKILFNFHFFHLMHNILCYYKNGGSSLNSNACNNKIDDILNIMRTL